MLNLEVPSIGLIVPGPLMFSTLEYTTSVASGMSSSLTRIKGVEVLVCPIAKLAYPDRGLTSSAGRFRDMLDIC